MDVSVSYTQRLYFHPGFSSVLVHLLVWPHFHSYKSGGLSALSEKYILSFCEKKEEEKGRGGFLLWKVKSPLWIFVAVLEISSYPLVSRRESLSCFTNAVSSTHVSAWHGPKGAASPGAEEGMARLSQILTCRKGRNCRAVLWRDRKSGYILAKLCVQVFPW